MWNPITHTLGHFFALASASARGQSLQTLLPLFEGLNLDATRQSGASLCVGGIVANLLAGNLERPVVEAMSLFGCTSFCVCSGIGFRIGLGDRGSPTKPTSPKTNCLSVGWLVTVWRSETS